MWSIQSNVEFGYKLSIKHSLFTVRTTWNTQSVPHRRHITPTLQCPTINIVCGNIRCLLWEPHGTHICTVGSPYLTGNTLHFHYRAQPANVVWGNSRYLLWKMYTVHSAGRKQSYGLLNKSVHMATTEIWRDNIIIANWRRVSLMAIQSGVARKQFCISFSYIPKIEAVSTTDTWIDKQR
jgi:hypothetical protein